jgi:hypothetical protein
MRIARKEDRFKIDLNGVEITVSALNGRKKLEMTSMIKQDQNGRFIIDKPSQEFFLVKHSIKDIKGLKDLDDQDYVLSFDGDVLTDECAEEVLGYLVNTWFTTANTQALSGLFGEVVSPLDGKPIKGISVQREVKVSEEKK